VTITFTLPLAGENFGPGYAVYVTTSLPSIPFNSRWFGRLIDAGATRAHSEWVAAATTSLVIQSTWGIDFRFNQPAMFDTVQATRHGQPGTCIVQLFSNTDQVLDSGQVAVSIDDVSGLPYLVMHWAGLLAGGAAGHDPMLDEILHDVQHTYVNQP
jgi:hypothetical protein